MLNVIAISIDFWYLDMALMTESWNTASGTVLGMNCTPQRMAGVRTLRHIQLIFPFQFLSCSRSSHLLLVYISGKLLLTLLPPHQTQRLQLVGGDETEAPTTPSSFPSSSLPYLLWEGRKMARAEAPLTPINETSKCRWLISRDPGFMIKKKSPI